MSDLTYGAQVTLRSVIFLIGLTALKALVGYYTNAVVLSADAVSSFGDIFSMFAIFVGLLISQRKANKFFRYGYHRIETLVSLLVAGIMVYLGYDIMRESILRMLEPEATRNSLLGIATAIFSIGFSLFVHVRLKKVAQQIHSRALELSAIDKRNDAFISGGVLIGIVGNMLMIPYIEGVIGILIALLIIIEGVHAGKDAILYLLDYWDEPQTTQMIRKILSESQLVAKVHQVKLRHAGTFIFGEAVVEVSPFTDMQDFQDEIDRLNAQVREKIPHIGDFTIHLAPPGRSRVRIAIPVESARGLSSKIAQSARKKFSYLFVDISDGRVRKTFSKPFRFSNHGFEKIAQYLKDNRVNILVDGNMDAPLYYTLRLNKIKVYPTFSNIVTVRDTVKLLLLDV